MRYGKLAGLVPSVAYNVSTRRLLTNSKRPNSSPYKSQSHQQASGRFLPAKPGTRVAVPARQLPQTPAPTREVPQEEEEEEEEAAADSMPSTAEELHIHDVEELPPDENQHNRIVRVDRWRFVFPRGACPKRAWWDRQKPAETKPSELRWTSGKMYSHFGERFVMALEFSITPSSVLGAAGVWAVVSHTDGTAPTSTCLSVFTALALPTFAYGIYRSRILQEAWIGLVGSQRARRGGSMMPYIHPDAKWNYMWWLCPMKAKLGDYVAFR